jgi:hypothetical protein
MKIHEFYYNEDTRSLYVEFSTKQDGNDFYRVIDFEYEDIEYYSPIIITENDLKDIEKGYVVELIEQYLLDNDLPEEQSL